MRALAHNDLRFGLCDAFVTEADDLAERLSSGSRLKARSCVDLHLGQSSTLIGARLLSWAHLFYRFIALRL
jgi:hypothetical protein